MISGAFLQERRAFAQAIFASGMLLGGACGGALAGIIGAHYGWKYVLFVMAFLPVFSPGSHFGGWRSHRVGHDPKLCPYRRLLSVPAFVAMIAAGICITFFHRVIHFVGSGLREKLQRFQPARSFGLLSLIMLSSLVLGVLSGGMSRTTASNVCLRADYRCGSGFPSCGAVSLAGQSSRKKINGARGPNLLRPFFMSWYHGPVTAVLHDMMPRRAHATSVGVYMFATQLIRRPWSAVVGKISDLRDLQLGLQIAVAVMVCGALLMLIGNSLYPEGWDFGTPVWTHSTPKLTTEPAKQGWRAEPCWRFLLDANLRD